MPFDLVAEVRGPRRVRARSNAYRAIRSTPDPREDRLLHGHLVGKATVEPTADLGVLPLDVLPHDHQVDTSRVRAAQGAGHPLHDLHRSDVRVLPERTTDRDQQPPQRDVVRTPGHPTAPSRNGVVGPQDVDRVGRHHGPALGVALARPVEVLVNQVQSVLGSGGIEDRPRRRSHPRSLCRRRDDGDAVRALGSHLSRDPRRRSSTATSSVTRIPPMMSKLIPDRIILVIGTTPEP
jgi:hypothetical protein